MAKSLGIFLSGDHLNTKDEHGERIFDDSFYMIFNSAENSVIFTIPDIAWGKSWTKILDTFNGFFNPESEELILHPGEIIEVRSRSVVLLINKREVK